MNNKQKKILENNFKISDNEYADGKYLELEAWTDGGVDMIIYVDLLKNDIISELEEYIDNFDIDEKIELYRQAEDYKNHFTIRESLNDFDNWLEWVKNIIKQLKEVK